MQSGNHKSVALIAREAAIEMMRRDVADHGDDRSVRRGLVDGMREAAERDFLDRIGFHLDRCELVAVSLLNGAPYTPGMGGTPPTDAIWLLSPEQQAKALELLGQRTSVQEATQAIPPRVPLMERNKEAVLVALRNGGFDPVSLEPYVPGKEWRPKQEAKKNSGLTKASFDHAWKGLAAEGKIKQSGTSK